MAKTECKINVGEVMLLGMGVGWETREVGLHTPE